MIKIKAHADDYNIVCEVLHNDNPRRAAARRRTRRAGGGGGGGV